MQSGGLFESEKGSGGPEQVEACPMCGADLLRVEYSDQVVLGCPVDESHYFQRLDRGPDAGPATPSLALRMLHALPARVSGRRLCYSEGCNTEVEFVNGRATCSGCGLDQKIVDLDDQEPGGQVFDLRAGRGRATSRR